MVFISFITELSRVVPLLPQVRVYSAEHVHEELRYAVHSYARAAVGISEKGKLLVPKLLYCYAHEIVEDRVLLDWVCNFLPSTQVAFIFECIQQHSHGHHVQSNNFAVVPFDFSFRYLFPSDICRSLRWMNKTFGYRNQPTNQQTNKQTSKQLHTIRYSPSPTLVNSQPLFLQKRKWAHY